MNIFDTKKELDKELWLRNIIVPIEQGTDPTFGKTDICSALADVQYPNLWTPVGASALELLRKAGESLGFRKAEVPGGTPYQGIFVILEKKGEKAQIVPSEKIVSEAKRVMADAAEKQYKFTTGLTLTKNQRVELEKAMETFSMRALKYAIRTLPKKEVIPAVEVKSKAMAPSTFGYSAGAISDYIHAYTEVLAYETTNWLEGRQ
jgi:hypothetical protein